jgi:prepilin-type N-terminal cleavage/methylation domain-containing protein
MKKSNLAFTLIELLVVVTIIGVLSAVGVVAYNGFIGAVKSNRATYDHNQAVKEMKTLLFACETQGYVSLKTTTDGTTSNFQCSSGASNLRVQFTVHFYLNGFRNSWTFRKGTTVMGILIDDYMIGYSCSSIPALGFMDICDESSTRMRVSTNVGTSNGETKVVTSYIDISR